MKDLSEKHLVVVTALALGLIIFWLIASDAKNAPSLSATNTPIGIIATATDAQAPN